MERMMIDGGSGGVDQLLIEGTSQTVLVIPDASGIATFGGRTVHYAGLEPFVDLSDPAAIIIHATALDDDLMLSDRLDQLNEPDGVELSSSLYRFLSNGSVSHSIVFSSSGTLSAALRASFSGRTILRVSNIARPTVANAASAMNRLTMDREVS